MLHACVGACVRPEERPDVRSVRSGLDNVRAGNDFVVWLRTAKRLPSALPTRDCSGAYSTASRPRARTRLPPVYVCVRMFAGAVRECAWMARSSNDGLIEVPKQANPTKGRMARGEWKPNEKPGDGPSACWRLRMPSAANLMVVRAEDECEAETLLGHRPVERHYLVRHRHDDVHPLHPAP